MPTVMQQSKRIGINSRLVCLNSLKFLRNQNLCNVLSKSKESTTTRHAPPRFGLDLACCSFMQTRWCSSDLKERGLKSLIPKVDTRLGESLKVDQFSANRRPVSKKDKYLTALATNPGVEEDEGLVETHLQSRNRNPRNMELLGYNKPRGYGKLYRRRDFWNRLNIVMTNSHTTAYVDHNTGEILVSASTLEFSIARHLWSNTDVCALANLGRVLAQRCKETGIDRVFCRMKSERKKEKVQAFFTALREEGLRLSEPKKIVLPHTVVSDPADFRPKKKKIKHFCPSVKSKYTFKK